MLRHYRLKWHNFNCYCQQVWGLKLSSIRRHWHILWQYLLLLHTEATLKTAGKDKAQRPDNLSMVTKQLREKRWQVKKNGTDVQHIDYTDICKAIRSVMSEDINNYNEEQLIQFMDDNKCIKTIKRKLCLGRINIISLKEENGTHIHDRDRLIKRCEEFYINLNRTKQPQGQPLRAYSQYPKYSSSAHSTNWGEWGDQETEAK